MHRKWIHGKDFVNDIVFRYTKGVPVSAVVARGKTSAGSLFYYKSQRCKCQQMKIKWRYFVPKIINIGLDLLELFEHITGVQNFLRHSVIML